MIPPVPDKDPIAFSKADLLIAPDFDVPTLSLAVDDQLVTSRIGIVPVTCEASNVIVPPPFGPGAVV